MDTAGPVEALRWCKGSLELLDQRLLPEQISYLQLTDAPAVAAHYHQLGFMVVAPTSTIDPACKSGADIPIEERAGEELLNIGGVRFAASGADAWNPVFDITPANLVQVLVTEKGVIEQPNRERIAALMKTI